MPDLVSWTSSSTECCLELATGGGGINGQVAVSALGSGRGCSPRLPSPTVLSVASSAFRSADVFWPFPSLNGWVAATFRAIPGQRCMLVSGHSAAGCTSGGGGGGGGAQDACGAINQIKVSVVGSKHAVTKGSRAT